MPRSVMLALLFAGCGQESGFGPECEAKGVRLEEIYAANEFDVFPPGLETSSCGKPDWVEIYNASGREVDLTDWVLTPTVLIPGQRFGEETPGPIPLGAGERVVVLALPYDQGTECDPASYPDWPEWLFMGVDLDRDNGRLILKSPNGGKCDDIFYPDQHVGWSWSRFPEGDDVDRCAMAEPTPFEPNAGAIGEERYLCDFW